MGLAPATEIGHTSKIMPRCKVVIALLAALAAPALAGCASTVGTSVPVWAGGEPASVPPPSAEPTSFPLVQESAPPRPTKPMSEAEEARVEAELTALRKRVTAESAPAQKGQTSKQAR